MNTPSLPQRVALVYDWVNTPFGGAERVLLALHKLFPHSPLYTSLYDPSVAKWAQVFDVKTSYLQEIPFAKQKHRELLPLMNSAFEHFDLSNYDLVISVTSAQAKAVNVRKGALHICYLLTPTRYLWSHTHEYQTGLLKPIKAWIFSQLRRRDFHIAQKPDIIIPISKLVQKRTKKYYRRKTEPVIYPPFTFQPATQHFEHSFNGLSKYYLVVSRLVEYKKVHLCIETCAELKKPLVIIGEGPEHNTTKALIEKLDPEGIYIHWYQHLSDEQLQQAYFSSKALLLPAEEDFGITALEAQAFGKPVVVYQQSGAAEVVQEKVSGIHFSSQTKKALSLAISQLEKNDWDSTVIKSNMAAYNEQAFVDQFQKAVQQAWEHHQKGSYAQ